MLEHSFYVSNIRTLRYQFQYQIQIFNFSNFQVFNFKCRMRLNVDKKLRRMQHLKNLKTLTNKFL